MKLPRLTTEARWDLATGAVLAVVWIYYLWKTW